MDTLGSIIDKLITVDMKLWNSQELVYEIRRMTWEEFKLRFETDEEFLKKFYTELNKATNLNHQRNLLIDEFDKKLVEAITSGDTTGLLQEKFKTY